MESVFLWTKYFSVDKKTYLLTSLPSEEIELFDIASIEITGQFPLKAKNRPKTRYLLRFNPMMFVALKFGWL